MKSDKKNNFITEELKKLPIQKLEQMVLEIKHNASVGKGIQPTSNDLKEVFTNVHNSIQQNLLICGDVDEKGIFYKWRDFWNEHNFPKELMSTGDVIVFFIERDLIIN